MLITEFYNGQGLGNQLACYVTTRVLALDLGYDFGVMHPERFKGADFMDLDFGQSVDGGFGPEGGPPIELPNGIQNYIREKSEIHPVSGADIRGYDDSLRSISDNTKLDGLLQGEKYVMHRKTEIAKWLKIKNHSESIHIIESDVCVINYRGGEYVGVNEFHLNNKYWENAMDHMRNVKSTIRFIVITDDIISARKIFKNIQIYHFSIGGDYAVINNAHYLILSNSSFAWYPAWLNENLKFCIAPKYWGRHNVSDGYWSLGSNITSGWYYLDRVGQLSDYSECIEQLEKYENDNSKIKAVAMYDNEGKRNRFITLKFLIKKYIPKKIFDIYKLSTNYRRNTLNFIYHNITLYKNNLNKKNKITSLEEIIESKKNLKIYDVFYFFNELDLLEIRLNILDDFVDKFILIEAAFTFGGESKGSNYLENFDRFSKWNHKINHYWISDFESDKELLKQASLHPNVGNGEAHWVREFYFKESAKKALLNLEENDIVFISDLDEIWNPMQLKLLTDFSSANIIRPIQLSYYYYLNNRSNEHRSGWTGTTVCFYKIIANGSINDIRSRHITKTAEVPDGGWHLTYMGGAEGARKKLFEQNHPEYNIFIDTIEQRVNDNKDYAGRNLKFWIDESDLPNYFLTNKFRWKHLFKY